MQYNINRQATKISALSLDKIDKYEYLTGEEILPSNQRQIIEQANFAYFPLGKALKKQTEKQVDALKALNPSNRTNELKQIEDMFQKTCLVI